MAVGKKYPEVLRISDPLLIRIDKHSLLVNDTTFWAKIKNGIQWKGFMVYVSGTNMPIYEDKKDVPENRDSRSIEAYLNQSAENWINSLAEAILEKKSDNEVKRAIDRLCWQLHYDITESDTDFVTQYASENFSDNMTIDTQSSENSLKTIPTTAVDTAQIITGYDGSTTYGSLYDISSKINSFSSTMNTVMGTLNSNVNSIDGRIVTLNSNITTLDSNMNNSSVGTIVKIAKSLRADENEYTISKALRDKDDQTAYGGTVRSVSCSVKLQTDLEESKFVEISDTKLGDFGTSGNKTLYYAVGAYAASGSTDNISAKLNTLDTKIGTSSDTSSENTVFGKSKVIIEKLGNSGDTSNTSIWGDINDIQNSVSSVSAMSSNVTDIMNRIGTASTSGTLWYDLFHNAGTREPGVISDTKSIRGILGTLQSQWDTVYRSIGAGPTPCLVSWSSTTQWNSN